MTQDTKTEGGNGFSGRLRDILTLAPDWVDEGQGHYVKKRRLRPAVKTFCWVGALGLLAAAGVGLFMRGASEPEPSLSSQQAEAPSLAPVRQEGPKALALPPLPPAQDETVAYTSVRETAGRGTTPPAGEGAKPLLFVPKDVTLPGDEAVLPDEGTLPLRPSGQGASGTQSRLRIGPNPRPGKNVPSWQRPYWIRVSKGDYTLSLYRGQDVVKTYSVAIGENPGNKRFIGDHRTPTGDFRVVSIEDASRWKHDFGDGTGKIAGAYGPWFIRLDAGGWKGIGIHGTHDPDSRGTMATEGCIRLSNEEISELRRYAYRSMRVVIEE